MYGSSGFYGNCEPTMPIVKVPVEHKFGVVSLNRAEELLKKQKENAATKDSKPSRQEFNNQFYIMTVYQILSQCRTETTSHVDIAFIRKVMTSQYTIMILMSYMARILCYFLVDGISLVQLL